MSLVRDRYWIDPKGLDAARAELRASVFRAIVREVVAGADGRATVALLREAATGQEGLAEDLTDLFGSDLPGTFTVVYESWQGVTRNDFVTRAAYHDPESEAVCLLSASQCLEDPEPHVDSIWLSLSEFRALGELAFPAARSA